MDSSIIVMIVTLAMPSGDNAVQVTPFRVVDQCIRQADIEATDPKVLHVECAALSNGILQLNFGPAQKASDQPVRGTRS